VRRAQHPLHHGAAERQIGLTLNCAFPETQPGAVAANPRGGVSLRQPSSGSISHSGLPQIHDTRSGPSACSRPYTGAAQDDGSQKRLALGRGQACTAGSTIRPATMPCMRRKTCCSSPQSARPGA